jgi:ubiquinone/menaquinone biosynthesis C-methylase UbiE
MTQTGQVTRLKEIVQEQALLWGDDVGDTYHKAAEADVERGWQTYVMPLLVRNALNPESAVDFACGRGRNTAKLLAMGARQVTMVDVNPENLAYCRKRFKGDSRVSFAACDGFGLANLGDSSASLFFTFDSMVHFDLEIVLAYVPEIFRVVAPGGGAFIHHSNYTGSPGTDFRANPGWRNFMSAPIFRHAALRAGFEVAEQCIIDWGTPNLDCISVLRKPR